MSAFNAHGMIRLVAVLILGLGMSAVNAQPVRVADLGISATLTPSGVLSPGTRAQLELVFHNHGPENAVRIGASSSGYPFLSFELFRLEPALPSPCSMFFEDLRAPPGSGRPSVLLANIRGGPLAPGATITCTLDLVVAARATGNFQLSFGIRDSQAVVIDGNPSNDLVVLPLSFVPQPRPIPTEGWPALSALVAALLAIGALALRPRRFRARRVTPDGGARWRA